MARGRRCRAGCRWRRHAYRPLAAAARAMKPPPTEQKAAAAEFDARCGGNQQTPQRPQQRHGQWKPRQQRRQRQRQCSSNSSAISVIISSSGSSDGSSSLFSTVGRRKMQRQRLASALISIRRSAWRESGVTAVCLGGPSSADFGRRRLFEPEGVLIQSELEPCGMPAMHCACILTAVHRVLVQSSPSRPRPPHRARPTALVLPLSSSALTPPRSSHYVRPLYTYRPCTYLYVRPQPHPHASLAPTIYPLF